MEIDSQENSLVMVKQKALSSLLALAEDTCINQEAIREHMEVISKKWQRLKHVTVQRYVCAARARTCVHTHICIRACMHMYVYHNCEHCSIYICNLLTVDISELQFTYLCGLQIMMNM